MKDSVSLDFKAYIFRIITPKKMSLELFLKVRVINQLPLVQLISFVGDLDK